MHQHNRCSILSLGKHAKLWLAFVLGLFFSFYICPTTSQARGFSFRDEPCFTATQRVERILHIPDGFLYAISRVETAQSSLQGGTPTWPWTVNAEGTGYHYESKNEAIDAVEQFQKRGLSHIDVGCLQVDIHHHPEAFISLEQAFDPFYNTLYAGKFLITLHEKTRSWPLAAAAYHSQTPELGKAYQWKVLQAWSLPQTEHASTPSPYTLHAPWRRPPIAHPIEPFVPHVVPSGAAIQTHHSTPPPNMANSVRVPENGERNRTLQSYRMHPVRRATELPIRSTPY